MWRILCIIDNYKACVWAQNCKMVFFFWKLSFLNSNAMQEVSRCNRYLPLSIVVAKAY